MYICSISMINLDDRAAKDLLTVNQYAKIVSILNSRNDDIKSWYKSVLSESKIQAISKLRTILINDSSLSGYQNLLKFSVNYIELDEMWEFYPSNEKSLYIENFSKFSISVDDFEYNIE